MLHITQYLPITDPTWIFFIVLCIILFAPIIMGRLRIPHIIGMILAGIIIGPHGFNILENDSSFKLFGNVGLYFIMLLGGLEMNMVDFRNNRIKTFTHGILAFTIPMALGFVLNILILKYSVMTSILLASMYASHTLIAYPIVMRYGLSQQRSVTIAVGATAITDTLTLIVLAIVSGMFKGNTSGFFGIFIILKISVAFFLIIYFFPRIARIFFQKYENNVTQFIFVLAMTFMGAGIMEIIGMEGLLGAFLTGLVLNRYIPKVSPLMNNLEFIGNALFIPYLLIGVGMMVNIKVLFNEFNTLEVACIITIIALASKWIASFATQKIFRLKPIEREMIFGLSNAQAGATLAAILVGYNIILPNHQRLLNDEVLNGTIILILITCIFSSLTTERAAKKLALNENNRPEDKMGDDEKIMIPVTRPDTADELVTLGIMMRNIRLNRGLIGLNVVLDDMYCARNQETGKKLLEKVKKTASTANVRIQVQSRIATNISNGIVHAFKENNASEMIIGMHNGEWTAKDFWGNTTMNLFTDLSRQIIIIKIRQPVNTLRRIQVVVPEKAEFEPGFYRWIERLSRLASNLGCRIQFHGKNETLVLVAEYIRNRYDSIRADYEAYNKLDEIQLLSHKVNPDHLFIVVTARKGTVSYQPSFDKIPDMLIQYFSSCSLMIIYPDQYGDSPEIMSFMSPHNHQNKNAYISIHKWLHHKIYKKNNGKIKN
jgi:Kef-type K+ transport system membrane component KefB